jgi:hypothetical protein
VTDNIRNLRSHQASKQEFEKIEVLRGCGEGISPPSGFSDDLTEEAPHVSAC